MCFQIFFNKKTWGYCYMCLWINMAFFNWWNLPFYYDFVKLLITPKWLGLFGQVETEGIKTVLCLLFVKGFLHETTFSYIIQNIIGLVCGNIITESWSRTRKAVSCVDIRNLVWPFLYIEALSKMSVEDPFFVVKE